MVINSTPDWIAYTESQIWKPDFSASVEWSSIMGYPESVDRWRWLIGTIADWLAMVERWHSRNLKRLTAEFLRMSLEVYGVSFRGRLSGLKMLF